MNRLSIFFILLLLVLTQLACNFPGTQLEKTATPLPITAVSIEETPLPVDTKPPEPTSTTQVATGTPSSQINLELLKNFTFVVDDFNTQVTLVDGAFSDGQIQSRLSEPIGLGDINGDGRTDAAVVLIIDPSGSGTFYYLTAVLDLSGTLVQAGFSYIGDRQILLNLEIANGRILLDYITQGLSDPLCCPSEHRYRSYLLETGGLHLASEQIITGPAAQVTPLPNAILIDQPADGNTLTTPLQVRGRVSQAPPEMKLAYYVTDLSATLLAQGEVAVEGEPGGPGAFAFEVTLEALPPGLIQLELVDTANGVLRGRSTIVLVMP